MFQLTLQYILFERVDDLVISFAWVGTFVGLKGGFFFRQKNCKLNEVGIVSCQWPM